MSKPESLTVTVSKLAIQPGEVLVIKMPPGLTKRQSAEVVALVKASADELRRKGAIPQDNMVVILPGAYDIGYVRAEEAEAFLEVARDLEVQQKQTGN